RATKCRPWNSFALPARHDNNQAKSLKETAMATDRKIVLYHAPNSRSGGTLLLLEELGAPYELRLLNLNKNDQRQPAYLAVNPMGKVPAIVHGDALITARAAFYIYLAYLSRGANLAPRSGAPLRGPSLRWLVFSAACFEPAVVDSAFKPPPVLPRQIGYGDYDTTIKTLN